MLQDLHITGDPEISPLTAKVDAALRAALDKNDLNPDKGIYGLDGMSGKKYRYFINHLVGSIPDARYLEIGCWMGSTLCSAIHGNAVQAVAIDNWSEFGGPKETFERNVKAFLTPEAYVTFIEADFRKVLFEKLQKTFNVYMFDGPHEAEDQYQGLSLPLPCLDDQFVFIVDDWNWGRVRAGTLEAVNRCPVRVLYAAELRTTLNDGSPPHLLPLEDFRVVRNFDWHNGYYISVMQKV